MSLFEFHSWLPGEDGRKSSKTLGEADLERISRIPRVVLLEEELSVGRLTPSEIAAGINILKTWT